MFAKLDEARTPGHGLGVGLMILLLLQGLELIVEAADGVLQRGNVCAGDGSILCRVIVLAVSVAAVTWFASGESGVTSGFPLRASGSRGVFGGGRGTASGGTYLSATNACRHSMVNSVARGCGVRRVGHGGMVQVGG